MRGILKIVKTLSTTYCLYNFFFFGKTQSMMLINKVKSFPNNFRKYEEPKYPCKMIYSREPCSKVQICLIVNQRHITIRNGNKSCQSLHLVQQSNVSELWMRTMSKSLIFRMSVTGSNTRCAHCYRKPS